MQRGLRAGIRWTALVCGSTLSLAGQTSGGSGSPSYPSNATLPAIESAPLSGTVFREIDDPFTGARWLLLRNSNHSGGPGHLVLAPESGRVSGVSASRGIEAGPRLNAVALVPVIRTGDRLIVEEHSAAVDEQLEAVALGPAAVGSSFEVRLEIGGKVFHAVALGAGRAAFAPADGEPR